MATVSCPHDLHIDKLPFGAGKERSCNLKENMKLYKIKQVQQSPAKYSHAVCTSELSITELVGSDMSECHSWTIFFL